MIAPIDITNVTLETPRLILRPWRESDLEDFYAYASVDGVGQMAGWAPHRSMEESRRILTSFIAGKKTFALELKETGRVVGSLGLEEQDPAEYDHPELLGRELGFVLAKDCWGLGLMPEAAEAVIRYCFDSLDLDFLTCGHFKHNDRSRRVIEKLGFTYLKDIEFETRFGTVESSRLYILHNKR